MLKKVWNRIHTVLTGGRLSRAIERNEKAADELDALLRKVLSE